jgi:putative ABC transport system substrate-binding protein
MAAQAAADGKNIPVLFSAVSDPVSAKLVESLEVTNRGATGTSDALPLEKQMQMIRAFLPEAKKIGILYTTNEVNSQSHLETFKALAPQYGFEIVAIGVNTPSDIPLAVDTLLAQVDCVNNFTDNNVVNNLAILIEKAKEKKIPVFGSEEEQVRNGCIASESIDYVELGRETAKMAAAILKGSPVDTLPVKVISESKPVANKEVMEALGIELPEAYEESIEYLK